MNFTREPIIETVITPKEGCKLVIRNSKGGGQEEFFVDAVEVVSFGNSLFFRSTERPKSFLVPVSDYEVLELKETRMVLKNVAHEHSIKIGVARGEATSRAKEQSSEESKESPKKREKRRTRRRKSGKAEPEKEAFEAESEVPKEVPLSVEEAEKKELKKLFPPPSTLIKERLSSYKTAEIIAEDLIPKDLREMQKEEPELKKEKKTKEEEELPGSSSPPEKEKKDEGADIVEKTLDLSKDGLFANKERE